MSREILFLIFALTYGYGSSSGQNPYLNSGYGYVVVEGGEIWYGILGEGDETPYLYLHGGPGGKSKGGIYLNDISDIRPVILMDQLGGGLSTFHEDTTLLKVDKFVQQVKALTDKLDLNEFYLTGHSWGTALALEYYIKHPEGVKGIVFNSPYFSTSIWVADSDTLITQLSETIQQNIAIAEKTNAFETKAYQNAMTAFYGNFMIRSTNVNWDSIPGYELFSSSFNNMDISGNNFIYNYMWGPSEFSPTGTLINYEINESLSKINVPVLFTTGEFDEARPSTVKRFASLVSDAEYIEIPNAGHASSIDNPQILIKAHRDFANRIDEE
jgi:proline iminopeptidase